MRIRKFEKKYGRSPDSSGMPFIHVPFNAYNDERKNRLLNCVKEKTKALLEVDDHNRVNISFRLWAGCMVTAKEISAGTQTELNTPESRRQKFEDIINPHSDADAIFKAGQRVASKALVALK